MPIRSLTGLAYNVEMMKGKTDSSATGWENYYRTETGTKSQPDPDKYKAGGEKKDRQSDSHFYSLIVNC